MYTYKRWAAGIAATQSVDDLLGLIREYIATITPSELSLLPEECRAHRLRDIDDLAEMAVTFAKCELATDPGAPAYGLLHEMALTFAAAQGRLRIIRGAFPVG
jgi:hypothetical protein